MPTAEQTRAGRWLRFLPSPLTTFTAAVSAVLAAVAVGKGAQDADYFWHMTTGRVIAETGRVPDADPFSFTWAGEPWTPHEWLGELLIYRLTEALGSVGALAIFGLLAAAALVVLAFMVGRAGGGVRALALPLVLGALVMSPYVTLRPQAISWLFLALLVWFLFELRPERPLRTLLLIPFFVLWANLHGLYVVGLGVLAVYGLFTLIGRTPMSPRWRWVVGAGIGCVLAGMATPAGPVGLLYPLRYVEGGDWGLANIQEWQSPDFHNPAHWPFLGLIVAVGLNAGRNAPGWLVALSWIGIAMGLVALRNVPIAVVFCLPVLAFGLQSRLGARRLARPRPARQALGRRVLELATAALVVAVALVILVPPGLGERVEDRLEAKYPVAGVQALAQIDPATDVLAEYGWGGYVIHELYDRGGRVFVDGRNDMYDQRILEDYEAIRSADPEWQALSDGYGVEALLLTPEAPVTRGPAEAAGWCQAYRDEVQVLYLRSCPG